MRYLVLFALFSAQPAWCDCLYDKELKKIICIEEPAGGAAPDGGAIGPVGPFFNRVPAEQVLLRRGDFLQTLTIPTDLTKGDREIIRQKLEIKRDNLENFRVWTEKNKNTPDHLEDYAISMEIYREGFEQYRAAMFDLK